MNIRIAPLPEDFLERARKEGLDAQGQPVRRVVASGGEPCRDVLRRAEAGEELILASFSPFSQPGPFREFGPVYLLANRSDEPVALDAFPANGYFRDRLVLRAYDRDESIRDGVLVTTDEVPEALGRLLTHRSTAFVHARFPVYGCFALRVDRG